MKITPLIRFLFFASASTVASAPASAESDFSRSCTITPDARDLTPYRAYGFSSPAKAADLAFSSAGVVKEVLVEQGDYVKKGDPLVLLEPRSQQEALFSAQARLKALLGRYTSAVTLGKNHYMAEVEISEIESSLAEARYQLATIEREIKELTLAAPFSGLVESTLIEVGEYASLGQSGIRLTDTSQQKVSVDFFPGGRSQLCRNAVECIVYVGHGGGLHGPFALDYMVPLTQGNRGMFQAGVRTDLPETSGYPVDVYLVPLDACTSHD